MTVEQAAVAVLADIVQDNVPALFRSQFTVEQYRERAREIIARLEKCGFLVVSETYYRQLAARREDIRAAILADQAATAQRVRQCIEGLKECMARAENMREGGT